MSVIAIQGIEGSFHHEAALRLAGQHSRIQPHPTFAALFDSVARGKAYSGVAAFQNLVENTVNQVHHLVFKHRADLSIVGWHKLRIDQYLLGHTALNLENVNSPETTIETHPVAFGQCTDTLESKFPHANRRDTTDTAESVKET